jgi:uncharacterized protein YacL
LRIRILINAALLQACWFVCVLGAARNLYWPGYVIVLVTIGWHLSRTTRPRMELLLVAVSCAVGVAVETILTSANMIQHAVSALWFGLTPGWMVALWAAFATNLNVALRALRNRPLLSATLGAVGGPVSYYGGASLGALQFPQLAPAMLCIAVAWILAMLILMHAAKRLDGVSG